MIYIIFIYMFMGVHIFQTKNEKLIFTWKRIKTVVQFLNCSLLLQVSTRIRYQYSTLP